MLVPVATSSHKGPFGILGSSGASASLVSAERDMGKGPPGKIFKVVIIATPVDHPWKPVTAPTPDLIIIGKIP